MQKYSHVRICTNTHAYTYKHTLTYPQHAQILTHIYTTQHVTFVNIHKYIIHIIRHRPRLTNTCAQAHSETHVRTLNHTYTNMHTCTHRFEAYTQICIYPYFNTEMKAKTYSLAHMHAQLHTRACAHTHTYRLTHLRTPSYKHIASCQLKYLQTYTCIYMH